MSAQWASAKWDGGQTYIYRIGFDGFFDLTKLGWLEIYVKSKELNWYIKSQQHVILKFVYACKLKIVPWQN